MKRDFTAESVERGPSTSAYIPWKYQFTKFLSASRYSWRGFLSTVVLCRRRCGSFVALRREAAVSNSTEIVTVAAHKSDTFHLLPWVGFGYVLSPEYYDENLDTVSHFSSTQLYRVIQKDGEIVWEVIVSVIVRKKTSYEHVCNSESLLRVVWIYEYKNIVNCNREREVTCC